MSIPIKSVILEAPDCGGKSTLYKELHKATNFKYNIHDRSSLSMLCYARLYERDYEQHRQHLVNELCDINIFHVMLMPPLDVIMNRYHARGDEFQNESSLKRVYDIFSEEVAAIGTLPNVRVIYDYPPPAVLARQVSTSIELYSSSTAGQVFKHASSWSKLSQQNEVQLAGIFEVDLEAEDGEIFNDLKEGEYYLSIYQDCLAIVDSEKRGQNLYCAQQGKNSRRFFYNSDTCISSIHFLPRDNTFKVIVNLRSTDSVKNGSIDMEFLETLSRRMHKHVGYDTTRILLDVRFNSLHIR